MLLSIGPHVPQMSPMPGDQTYYRRSDIKTNRGEWKPLNAPDGSHDRQSYEQTQLYYARRGSRCTEMYCLWRHNADLALVDVSSPGFIHRCAIVMGGESTCDGVRM